MLNLLTRALTQDIIDSIEPELKRDIYLKDGEVSGLRVKITPKGKTRFRISVSQPCRWSPANYEDQDGQTERSA